MITVSDKARSVLGSNYRYYVRAQSWRDGELLHDDVPVSSAQEEGDRSLAVPERVTFNVPARRRSYDWSPTYDLHPLAANGQQLTVQLGIDVGPDGIEWVERGTFVITKSEDDGRGGVVVEAAGLLYLVHEARYASPYQPSGTLKSTLQGLIEPALTVVFDSSLTDRSVPTDVNYDGSRLDAVHQLLDSWPAEAEVTPDGYLYVHPLVTPTTADLELSSDRGGTVVRRVGGTTRDGAFNVVVAKGRASDGADIQETAYDTTGPRAWGGPFNPLPVTHEFFSPLLTTRAQCAAAARSVLARLKRSSGREYHVEAVPDPTLQLGDAITVNGELCTVEKLGLPYRPGIMTLTVRTVV